jgi:HAD superfamily hydrolase (TIGR01509 family)
MCPGELHFGSPIQMRQPGIIFDLDGTLVDSVYQHVTAWHEVLRKSGIAAAQWRIHCAIGMSGKLFLRKLLRDEGHRHSEALIGRLESGHAKRFTRLIRDIAPVRGAANLLKQLKRRSIPFAIATSGSGRQTTSLLRQIAGRPECPVITADDVAAAKPAPDLFELAANKLGKEPADCFIVGDSVWDVLAGRRMNASVIALRSGGFDGHELQEAGAYRVYADPLELGASLEELGFPLEFGK